MPTLVVCDDIFLSYICLCIHVCRGKRLLPRVPSKRRVGFRRVEMDRFGDDRSLFTYIKDLLVSMLKRSRQIKLFTNLHK